MNSDASFDFSQIQKWMQSVLLSPENRAEQSVNFINDSSRLSAARHLNIYRQSYIARLRECMKNQFSALDYALGEGLFQMFADQYLEAHPSNSYTLNDLGRNFPAFLENTRPDAESDKKETWIDFMIELADFEYSISVIFDEHAEENVRLANDSAPDEKLKLIPVFHLFRHTYPVCRYYLDVVKKNNPELPFEEESFCVVSRHDYRLSLLEINAAQFCFLKKMAETGSMADAKEHTVKEFNFEAERFAKIWKNWRKNFIAASFLMESSW